MTVTTEIAQFMRKLEGIWDGHVDALLKRRDVDAAMAEMTAQPSVRHLPLGTGADGRAALDHFYRDVVLTHLPSDLRWTRRSRTVDRFRLVDELTVHVAPVLLGRGERLFEDLGGGPAGLEPVELVASPAVAHFRYARTG